MKCPPHAPPETGSRKCGPAHSERTHRCFPAPLSRQNHQVIGIPYQSGVCPTRGALRPVEQSVEPVQKQVRQQRRNHTALRRPFLVSGHLPAGSVPARFHHHRLQPHPDQTQYTSVCHPMPQTRQQLLVRDRIELGFKIGVVHRLTTRLQMPADLLPRLMRIPPRPETVRTVQKIRFENRLQHQQRGHLHHPVPDRRNPQRPQLAIRLRDVHSPHRLR